MHDAQEAAAEGGGFRDATPNEIARPLGSVWQRFSGVRPKSTSIEIGRDAVRCVIEEGVEKLPSEGDGKRRAWRKTSAVWFPVRW
jgi:hypothetical protein